MIMMLPTNYQKHTDGNPVQQLLIRNFYRVLISELRKIKPDSILDAGCGEGFTLNKLHMQKIGKTLTGIDILPEALEIGHKMYPSLELKNGSIYNLPFKNESFDLVLATEVLEHLENPQNALDELKRVSKKYIVLSVPNEPLFQMTNFLRGKYMRTFGNHPEHIQHWTARGFEKFVRKNGLRIVKRRHPYAWTLMVARKV